MSVQEVEEILAGTKESGAAEGFCGAWVGRIVSRLRMLRRTGVFPESYC